MITSLEEEKLLGFHKKKKNEGQTVYLTHAQRLIARNGEMLTLLISAPFGLDQTLRRDEQGRVYGGAGRLIYGIEPGDLPAPVLCRLPDIYVSDKAIEGWLQLKGQLPQVELVWSGQPGREGVSPIATHCQKLKAPTGYGSQRRELWLVMDGSLVGRAKVLDVVESVWLPEKYEELVHLPVLQVTTATFNSWLQFRDNFL